MRSGPKRPRASLLQAFILNSHGHVLLVKHIYGPLNWELPGGAAERDESPTETSVREVLEETGLRVSAERLTGVYYERAGTASGVFNTSRQIGGALAIAVFGALLADQTTFLQGMRSSLLIAAVVAMIAAAASLLPPMHQSARRLVLAPTKSF
jgi:ADP-ribose pyrophosphatase YjhB (NUDIX family)